MARERGDGRVQEGQMAVSVGGGAGGNGKEPDGAGAVGQGGPDGWRGRDGRVQEGQMEVAGSVGW